MARLSFVLALLLLLGVSYAHEGGEIRFVNSHILEYHSGDFFEFAISDEHGTPVNPLPFPQVEIYRNNKLVSSAMMDQNDEGYYFAPNTLGSGDYEIRPTFQVDGRIVSASFDYTKENFIDWLFKILFGWLFPTKTIHEHADLALYVNGTRYNFSRPEYMASGDNILSELIHLHDMKGNIIHKHASGITLRHFFGTLGIKINDTCVVANDTSFCGNARMFVNGKERSHFEGCDEFSDVSSCVKKVFFENYEFSDLDRILIAYGDYSDSEISQMISSVSDEACIQSGKCPERGTPSNESCSIGKCE